MLFTKIIATRNRYKLYYLFIISIIYISPISTTFPGMIIKKTGKETQYIL